MLLVEGECCVCYALAPTMPLLTTSAAHELAPPRQPAAQRGQWGSCKAARRCSLLPALGVSIGSTRSVEGSRRWGQGVTKGAAAAKAAAGHGPLNSAFGKAIDRVVSTARLHACWACSVSQAAAATGLEGFASSLLAIQQAQNRQAAPVTEAGGVCRLHRPAAHLQIAAALSKCSVMPSCIALVMSSTSTAGPSTLA